MVTQNHYNNTKYILNAMSLVDSPTPPTRETNREYKQKMNKAKSYADMAEVFGIDRDEVRALSEEEPDGMARLEALLPRWKQRRDEILLLSRLENDDTF
jgi:tRNA-dihydrouridine synthase 2